MDCGPTRSNRDVAILIALALVGVAFFFAYFDVVNLGTVLPRVIDEFGISKSASATVIGLGLWGYIAGGVLASALADRSGRRVALLLAVTLYGVGSLVNGISGNIEIFSIARFVSGMGIGATINVISTYMSELAPPKYRGRYMAWVTFPALVGYALVPIVSSWLVPHLDIGWRLILIIPVIGTVCLLLGYRLLPESARWLAARGRTVEAEQVVTTAETRAAEMTGRPLPAVSAPVPMAKEQSHSLLVIFSRRVLPWTILFFVMWALNCIPAYGVIGAVSPTIVIAIYNSFGFEVTWMVLGAIFLVVAVALLPTRNTSRVSLEAVDNEAELTPAKVPG